MVLVLMQRDSVMHAWASAVEQRMDGNGKGLVLEEGGGGGGGGGGGLEEKKNEMPGRDASQKQVANSKPVAQKLPRAGGWSFGQHFWDFLCGCHKCFSLSRLSGEDVNSAFCCITC